MIECGTARDIVHEQCTSGSTVIASGDSPEPFLSGGIPNTSLRMEIFESTTKNKPNL